MPWLKFVHMAAVILWCGSLAYLLSVLVFAADRPALFRALPRTLFTHIVTPSALLAIGSGTTIFVVDGPLAAWLAVKLGMVSLVVLGHAACGLLVLRLERGRTDGVRFWGLALAATAAIGLAATAWLVLRKPV